MGMEGNGDVKSHSRTSLVNTTLDSRTFNTQSHVERSSARLFGGDLTMIDSSVLMSYTVDDQSPLGHVFIALAEGLHLHGYIRVRREYVETDGERMRLVLAPPCHLNASMVYYTLPTNGFYRVSYRIQRFHVERKGSILSHFREKGLRRSRLESGFRMEHYAKRSHSTNC